MFKKIVVCIVLLFVTENITNASETKRDTNFYIKMYLKQYKGSRTISQTKKYIDQKCLQNANNYIFNKNKQKNVNTYIGNSDALKDKKKVSIKIADYPSALDALYDCAMSHKNPIAAWEVAYIIKSYLGKNYKDNMQKLSKVSKMLYKDKSCDGYIIYGNILEKGIMQKPDIDKALSVYKEGKKICNQSWYNTVLQMKINHIELFAKKK